MAIKSFKNDLTKALFAGTFPKSVSAGVAKVARRKLNMISAAAELKDLKVPPGNKLHGLFGNRLGQHAIRVNDQYRICFNWTKAGADNVEFTDYH